MDNAKLWAKLRPTAVVFALVMAALAWGLVVKVLGGSLGEAALGAGQAGAVVSAALIVVGTAVGGLGTALNKLCEDAPDPPPQQVPDTVVLALLQYLNQPAAGEQVIAQEVEGHRAREGLEG